MNGRRLGIPVIRLGRVKAEAEALLGRPSPPETSRIRRISVGFPRALKLRVWPLQLQFRLWLWLPRGGGMVIGNVTQNKDNNDLLTGVALIKNLLTLFINYYTNDLTYIISQF